MDAAGEEIRRTFRRRCAGRGRIGGGGIDGEHGAISACGEGGLLIRGRKARKNAICAREESDDAPGTRSFLDPVNFPT